MSCAAIATAAVGVAPLVGVDEPLEQLPLLGARLAAPTSRARREGRCSCIVARARCRALFAAATLVSSSAAVSLAGQPSTSRAISAARWRGGSTCSAARNASSIVSRSTTTASGSSSLGATSSSSRSGYGCSHGTSANESQRGQAPRAAPQQVEADVRRDAVQPGAEQRAAVEAVAAAPRPQERLLHRVLGLVERREHPVAVDVQLAAVPLGELGERGSSLGRRSRVIAPSCATSCRTHVLPSGSAKSANEP